MEGNIQTDASKIFDATGSLETLQANIISVKNIATDVLTRVETKNISYDKITQGSTRQISHLNPPPR